MVSHRKKKLIALLCLTRLHRSRRRHWVHPLNQYRSIDGEHVKIEKMFNEYPQKFFEYTRMLPATFTKLLEIVGSTLSKQNTTYRQSIPVRVRLFILLRYLATGDNFRTIATNFSVGYTTVWKIVYEGLPVLWNCLKQEYVKCPTTDRWRSIVNDFYDRWNLPNCLGAIDGKHVVMEKPPHSGSLYYNYKGTFSIVLMATCDAEYNFTTIDVGGYGKQSDGGIFAGSTLGRKLKDETLQACGPRKLPNSDKVLPCYFVGDEAFPLTTYMMRPYPGKGLTTSKRLFNYRLSRARRCIENAFGIMAARFRIFRKPIAASPKQVENIVLASVALHNYLKTEESKMNPGERFYYPSGFGDDSTDENGEWRNEPPAAAFLSQNGLSIAAKEKRSKEMRDSILQYVINEGAVEWQTARIGL